MPLTPFHLGPHACVSLPLQRRLDVPVFIASNLAIDIEPLLVLISDIDYPCHGYCHTLLIGGFVGLLLGLMAFPFGKSIEKAMSLLSLPYSSRLWKMLLSGIAGAWLHILFDAPLYADIKPFYPSSANPLLGVVSPQTVYAISSLLFVPALVMYLSLRSSKAE